MCKVKKMNVYGRDVNVAEIKQKYINNIVEAAQKCDLIDRVILFGSSTQERCTDASDIDLAVFGEQQRSMSSLYGNCILTIRIHRHMIFYISNEARSRIALL